MRKKRTKRLSLIEKNLEKEQLKIAKAEENNNDKSFQKHKKKILKLNDEYRIAIGENHHYKI
jgi:hypothetical protein